jgi:membrane protein YqaA with SNARE-associated domain
MEKRHRLSNKRRQYLRWGFWVSVILILYFSLSWLVSQALFLLQLNPDVWSLYKGVESEVASRSLLGLFYATAFGALFIVALPVEVVFLFYLGLDYPVLPLIAIAVAGSVVGNVANYLIGWLIGPKPVKAIVKEKYGTFHRKMEKAGPFIIIVGNIIPFPSDLFSLFIGTVRFGLLRMMLYTAIGKAAQFLLLWLGYKYFIQYAWPYIGVVSPAWFLELIKSSFTG